MAVAPEVPAVPGDVVYGTGRMDESGRVADRAMTGALGWQPGDRLTFTAAAGVVIARRDPVGMVTMPAKPYLVIPAALRRRCGLRPGDHVLLAASPGGDTLTAYSFAVLDQALRAHAPGPWQGKAAVTAVNPEASRQAAVEAALVLLERMGLTPDDLTAVPQPRKSVPTFAEYVPVVAAAVSNGTCRAYGSYWNRVVEHWGSRRLDEPAPSEIRQLMAYVKTHVAARRNARGGRSAEEHLVAALRCLYRRAVDDGLIAEADNPARKVAKPRRLPTTRRALPDTRLAEINEAAATTGDDPELDTLLLRLHTETGCRRGGTLALRPSDLDPDQCLVLLREKGETVRWQPVSPTLMARLIEHARERHAPPGGQLLRYADGHPITSRRYDHLWTRLGRQLPWVRTQQVSSHWIRHTTLTWVERNFGYAVARAYAGHTDGGSETGATATYVRASLAEVAAALAALTGEPHPLATTEGW
jgi:integrase/recombinase XerC